MFCVKKLKSYLKTKDYILGIVAVRLRMCKYSMGCIEGDISRVHPAA